MLTLCGLWDFFCVEYVDFLFYNMVVSKACIVWFELRYMTEIWAGDANRTCSCFVLWIKGSICCIAESCMNHVTILNRLIQFLKIQCLIIVPLPQRTQFCYHLWVGSHDLFINFSFWGFLREQKLSIGINIRIFFSLFWFPCPQLCFIPSISFLMMHNSSSCFLLFRG